MVGLGRELALEVFRQVVEIMFGDFTTLIVDQLLNQATKMKWMYGKQINIPLVVRTPMGAVPDMGLLLFLIPILSLRPSTLCISRWVPRHLKKTNN